jgi:serine O-acetyltransferase
VNLSQGITIGQKNGGTRSGAPYIGDMVYMGTGAKVIGNVVVGNRAAIGANSVVIKDIPENAIVSGIPASILSYEGSYNYVGGFFDEEKYEKRIIKKEEITRNGGK